MTTELQNKEIKGLTLKQITVLVVCVISIAGLYFAMAENINEAQRISRDNNEILLQIRSDNKEEKRINEIRLKEIENTQRLNDARLLIIETILKK
jgi:cell division protein YceG involved in septum cleavage